MEPRYILKKDGLYDRGAGHVLSPEEVHSLALRQYKAINNNQMLGGSNIGLLGSKVNELLMEENAPLFEYHKKLFPQFYSGGGLLSGPLQK